MPKKEKTPWLLIGAFGAGLWWLFSGTASASTATPTSVSPAAQKYLTQIMTAQNAYLQGQTTQAIYNTAAAAILIAAAADPSCTGQDLATLHGVAGV